jgi:hypothetical protein
MAALIEKSRKHLTETISKAESDPYGIVEHVKIVERWAKVILKSHREADEEIVLTSVWLHDLGHYPIDSQDHAVRGEKRAAEFLKKINLGEAKIKKIAHCVRAHRCKDVLPLTIEAKIVACADSASHFIDFAYLDLIMCNKELNKNYSALEKLERDWRDVSMFAEVKKKLEKLYLAWKSLLQEFETVNSQV